MRVSPYINILPKCTYFPVGPLKPPPKKGIQERVEKQNVILVELQGIEAA